MFLHSIRHYSLNWDLILSLIVNLLSEMAVSYKQVKKDINTLYGPEVNPKKGKQAASKGGSSGLKEKLMRRRDQIFGRSKKQKDGVFPLRRGSIVVD